MGVYKEEPMSASEKKIQDMLESTRYSIVSSYMRIARKEEEISQAQRELDRMKNELHTLTELLKVMGEHLF